MDNKFKMINVWEFVLKDIIIKMEPVFSVDVQMIIKIMDSEVVL